MHLTILGPNLPAEAPGYLVVHAVGCRDLSRGWARYVDRCHEEHDTVRSLVEEWYGPDAGSFYEEAGYEDPETAWEHYVNEFHLMPCCAHLPYEGGA